MISYRVLVNPQEQQPAPHIESEPTMLPATISSSHSFNSASTEIAELFAWLEETLAKCIPKFDAFAFV
jgi:hypothetical protein